MAKEIERKFLVNADEFLNFVHYNTNDVEYEKVSILQGYLSTAKEATVRIRVINNKKALLTVKGENAGMTRDEYEFEIDLASAIGMMSMCKNFIDKIRYTVWTHGKYWEVDFFNAPCKGLVMAEIELKDESESVSIPSWCVEEVTGKPEYYNSNLSSSNDNASC